MGFCCAIGNSALVAQSTNTTIGLPIAWPFASVEVTVLHQFGVVTAWSDRQVDANASLGPEINSAGIIVKSLLN